MDGIDSRFVPATSQQAADILAAHEDLFVLRGSDETGRTWLMSRKYPNRNVGYQIGADIWLRKELVCPDTQQ
jgi:hypothetical protein